MEILQQGWTHLLNDQEVAAILHVSVATVRRWRLLRRGPIYVKLGASVRYRQQDLRDYIDRLASAPTSTEAA
jgi:predicted DNA-binding transcriptional regulator AlpA